MIRFREYNFNLRALFQGRIKHDRLREILIEKGELHFYGYYEIAKDNERDEEETYLKIIGSSAEERYDVYSAEELEVYFNKRTRDNFRNGRFERTVTFLNPVSKGVMDKISRSYDRFLFIQRKLQKTYSDECIEVYER
jgi:hypothetical protein